MRSLSNERKDFAPTEAEPVSERAFVKQEASPEQSAEIAVDAIWLTHGAELTEALRKLTLSA